MQNHKKGIIYAIITAVCWGFLAIALKMAARKIDSVTIVWFRFMVAFLFLALWQVFRNPAEFRIFYKPPVILVIAALALSWNYLSFMFGVHYTTPSNAQVFIQAGPLLLAVAGFLFFKEKISIRQIFGFTLAIGGFLLFFNEQFLSFADEGSRFKHGVFLVLLSACAWATYAILQKVMVAKFQASTLNLFLFGVPLLLFLPFVKLNPLLYLHWTWWLLLLFVGLNTLIAYTFIAKALQHTEANKVSIIIILNPVITFITMGVLTYINVDWIEHEKFTLLTIAGALLVVTGAGLVVSKRKIGRLIRKNRIILAPER